MAVNISREESLHPAMSSHHCSDCIHSYGDQTPHLIVIIVDSTRMFICPLTVFIFNPLEDLATQLTDGGETDLVADETTMQQVLLRCMVPISLVPDSVVRL